MGAKIHHPRSHKGTEGGMMICASCDDGVREDLKVAELFAKYDVPITFYIPGITELHDHEIKWLSDNFEVGSHTVSHRHLTKISRHDRIFEIKESKKILEDITDKEITKFCFPRGYYTEQIVSDVMGAGYNSARTVDVFNLDNTGFLEKPTIHLSCPIRKEYHGKDPLELAKQWFDKYIKEGGTYHFWFHTQEFYKYNIYNYLEQLLKYIKENK